jgi:hypothetical protein
MKKSTPSRNGTTKLYLVAALVSTLTGGTLNAIATDPAPLTGIKNVALVHGRTGRSCRS